MSDPREYDVEMKWRLKMVGEILEQRQGRCHTKLWLFNESGGIREGRMSVTLSRMRANIRRRDE
jgi:hypothetical protein